MARTKTGLVLTADAAAVVYDSRTGAVVHVHETVYMKGASRPESGSTEREALELAYRLSGKPGAKLRAIPVRPEELAERRALKVDVKKGTLRSSTARPRKRTSR
jgi:hypothetical protein